MAGRRVEEDLFLLGQNARTEFLISLETLDKSSVEVKAQIEIVDLRSEYQRFLLWATNLGLFQKNHSSLEYRLQDNEVIRSFTRSLLTSLNDALKEITSTANAESRLNNPSETSKPHQCDAEVAEVIEGATCFSDDDASSLESCPVVTGVLSDVDESMLALHFEDVIEAIDQLFSLASQIRSPSSRKLRTDVDLYREIDADVKSTYIRFREAAELQGIEQVFLQTRKSLLDPGDENLDAQLGPEDTFLVRRLQKANHLRRQQFEYWKRSKKELVKATSKAEQIKPAAPEGAKKLRLRVTLKIKKKYRKTLLQYLRMKPTPGKYPPPAKRDFLAKGDTPKLHAQAEGPVQTALSVTQTSQQMSSLPSSAPIVPQDLVLKDNKSTYSGASRGLTVHGSSGEILSWPKPPHFKYYRKDFECPYCFFICPLKYLSEVAWRDHFKHDLRPYICTYDDCVEPTVLYDSWEDWVRHEQWAHRQRIWRCPDHPQHEYSTRSAYEDHVELQHADSKLLLLSSELLTAQESVSRALDRPCPFCHRDYEDTFEMQQHVASHLEAVALLSVPNLDEDKKSGEGNSNSANSNRAESKAGDFDFTEVLVFPENEGPDELRSRSEAERRLFWMMLGIIDQSFNKASGESMEAKSSHCEELVRDWLEGDHAGRKPFGRIDHTGNVVDTYQQLAQVLQVASLEEGPNKYLLHLSGAIATFLADVLRSLPGLQEGWLGWTSEHRFVMLALARLGERMEISLRKAPSEGPALFVYKGYNGSTEELRLSLNSSHGESTHNIFRFINSLIRLLENIEGPLINQTDPTKALDILLAWRGWTYCVSHSSEDSIILKLSGEDIAELAQDLRQSYRELNSLIKQYD